MVKRFRSNSPVVAILLWVAIMILLVAGWVMNLVALCKCDFEPSYKAEVFRVVGVFVVPAGAVLGYIDIEDGNND